MQGLYGIGGNFPSSFPAGTTVGDANNYPSLAVDNQGRIVSLKTFPLPVVPTTQPPYGTLQGLPYTQIDAFTIPVKVSLGGTGLTTTPTNGQLLIGNTSTNAYALATLTGTTNQITVTNGAGTITLALPQNYDTGATPQLARLGLNQAADSSARMAATGQYFSAKFTCTVTLDWNNGNVQYIVLANNGQTFTFANPKDGARYVIILKQPASGAAGTVTWPTIKWVGGTTPTLTTTNGKVDVVTFVYDGTNSSYYGISSLNF